MGILLMVSVGGLSCSLHHALGLFTLRGPLVPQAVNLTGRKSADRGSDNANLIGADNSND